MPTALSTLKREHQKVLAMQADCITESGFVLADKRNDYNQLCKKEKIVRDGIMYLEELKRKPIY